MLERWTQAGQHLQALDKEQMEAIRRRCAELVAEATGHKTEKSFNYCLGIDEEELVEHLPRTARKTGANSAA